MCEVVSVSLDKCFYDLAIDPTGAFVRDNGHIIVVQCTGGNFDLQQGGINLHNC